MIYIKSKHHVAEKLSKWIKEFTMLCIMWIISEKNMNVTWRVINFCDIELP